MSERCPYCGRDVKADAANRTRFAWCDVHGAVLLPKRAQGDGNGEAQR